MSLLESYDSLLLDLDGTVWEGGLAIPGAVEAINSSGIPAIYITNNASRSPGEVAVKLASVGLAANAESVLTSSQAAASLARDMFPAGTRALVVGTDAFRSIAQSAGLEVVASADENPAVVLHGHNPATGWAQLTEAALAIQRGARYIASNTDTTLPMERGLAVGNGSMVAAVVSATGVVPDVAGKPLPRMFLKAAEALGSTQPLAVGDRLDTDIQGARAAGIDTLHVLTGVSGPWSLVSAPENQRPTYIADDMSSLKNHPAELRPGRQGGFTAAVEGEGIVLDGPAAASGATAALRTVLEVAWGMPMPPDQVRAVSPSARAAVQQWW